MPKNLWDNGALASDADLLDQCVYGSRLLGIDTSLVLHGGGNTSIKDGYCDITGRIIDAIYIKGSGGDLKSIERSGFAVLPIERLLDLLKLENLSDTDMMRELSAARFDHSMPPPSVEALMHAFIPFRAVLHSHADAILALTNNPNGRLLVQEVLGDSVVVVPYVKPGFDLAREVLSCWKERASQSTKALVLLNHGLFTFAESMVEAYTNHIEIVSKAESFLTSKVRVSTAINPRPIANGSKSEMIAQLRNKISLIAGKSMILSRECGSRIMSFIERSDLERVASQGPLTPDHVIRTKRLPLIGTDVEAFAREYTEYFERNAARSKSSLQMLDPAPRILLIPDLGMFSVGSSVAGASICRDIYLHTAEVIATCEDSLGGWRALDEESIFDVEYWELEQAKLQRSDDKKRLVGQVAVVTGAASGIGRACALELMSQGAAIIAVDKSHEVCSVSDDLNWYGVVSDVTNKESLDFAISSGVDQFGGVDIAVLAAGIFGQSEMVAGVSADNLNSVRDVNTDSVLELMAKLHPLLKQSPTYGRVVIVGSKNVRAPGVGAVVYSTSKAATVQIARIAALEWAQDRIRVNVVHPDAVFDTGLWTEELIATRAKNYNISEQEYRSRNLMKVEIRAEHVGLLVAEMCGPAFFATTGAQISIDGGNERTI